GRRGDRGAAGTSARGGLHGDAGLPLQPAATPGGGSAVVPGSGRGVGERRLNGAAAARPGAGDPRILCGIVAARRVARGKRSDVNAATLRHRLAFAILSAAIISASVG